MKNGKQILSVGMLAMMVLTVTGCEQMAMNSPFQQQPARPASEESDVDYVKNTSIVGGESSRGRGATEAAIEWADKYAKSAQELLFANKRITELEADKKQLNAKLVQLKAEVDSYRNELNDANAMLNEMKKDLKTWQANVLGYRKEMMAAQSAQLSALQKILELLGGEVASSEFKLDAEDQTTSAQ